jgi:hypothetical protein
MERANQYFNDSSTIALAIAIQFPEYANDEGIKE